MKLQHFSALSILNDEILSVSTAAIVLWVFKKKKKKKKKGSVENAFEGNQLATIWILVKFDPMASKALPPVSKFYNSTDLNESYSI